MSDYPDKFDDTAAYWLIVDTNIAGANRGETRGEHMSELLVLEVLLALATKMPNDCHSISDTNKSLVCRTTGSKAEHHSSARLCL